MNKVTIETNSKWDLNKLPYVTIVTPVYNREDTILRAMRSIENQSYKNIEYIVVDDGSTDNVASIVLDFMQKTWIPMMFIRKENGGVHTARNIAIKYARGEMYYCNDSDDESLPDSIERLVMIWEHIPDRKREEYFEIKARCKNQNEEEVGPRFPEGINDWKWEDIKRYYESINAENVGFRVMSILKKNPWPEPEDVTFVGEDFLWKKLRKEYKTYLSNEIVQIYHMEGDDHLDFKLNPMRSLQQCRNVYWRTTYTLNNYELFGNGNRKKLLLSRRMMLNVLRIKKGKNVKISLINKSDRIMDIIIRPLTFLMAYIYVTKYNIRSER